VSTEELEAWAKNDPVDRYIARLLESGWASTEVLGRIDARIESELDAAVALCEDEPLPEPMTALDGVYADPPRAPLEWYRGL
jgi:TPP-dependent pyruvate/acetoin dehydrogenase alpha subunit